MRKQKLLSCSSFEDIMDEDEFILLYDLNTSNNLEQLFALRWLCSIRPWRDGSHKDSQITLQHIFLHKRVPVEPPVSDHPKCKDSVVPYGRWSLTRIKPHEALWRRGPDTSTLWKITYCMQFLSYAMCSSMLSLKFFVYSKYYSAQSEYRNQSMQQVVVYKKVKNSRKILTFRAQNNRTTRWSFTRVFQV